MWDIRVNSASRYRTLGSLTDEVTSTQLLKTATTQTHTRALTLCAPLITVTQPLSTTICISFVPFCQASCSSSTPCGVTQRENSICQVLQFKKFLWNCQDISIFHDQVRCNLSVSFIPKCNNSHSFYKTISNESFYSATYAWSSSQLPQKDPQN